MFSAGTHTRMRRALCSKADRELLGAWLRGASAEERRLVLAAPLWVREPIRASIGPEDDPRVRETLRYEDDGLAFPLRDYLADRLPEGKVQKAVEAAEALGRLQDHIPQSHEAPTHEHPTFDGEERNAIEDRLKQELEYASFQRLAEVYLEKGAVEGQPMSMERYLTCLEKEAENDHSEDTLQDFQFAMQVQSVKPAVKVPMHAQSVAEKRALLERFKEDYGLNPPPPELISIKVVGYDSERLEAKVAVGETFMDVAKREGLPINWADCCGGEYGVETDSDFETGPSCVACHCYVAKDLEPLLQGPGPKELAYLDTLIHHEDIRPT